MAGSFFLTNWFLAAMRWVYSNVDSVFLSILISTIVLRCLTVFSDIKTRKSSMGMARVQPQIAKLQKKYQNDPQRLQIEQRKLMKQEGVSMWGSCLPMLITMPISFCFIYAFRYWGYEAIINMLVSDDPATLIQSYKFLWINNIWQPDNGLSPVLQSAANFLSTAKLDNLIYLRDNPELWQRLCEIGVAAKHITFDASGATVISYGFLTSQAAQAAYDAVLAPCASLYAGYNNGWFILPVLAGGMGFLSSWLSMRGQPQANEAAGQTSKMMLYMMPIMFFIFCLTSSAAFSLYWTLSSLVTIVVNLILNKKYPRTQIAQTEEKR